MPIGPTVRRLLGPLERPTTDLYRAFFVSLGNQVRRIRQWAPGATDILEIGCGEGAVCERLAAAYPTAHITGIDITPRAGRLCRHDRARIGFANVTAEEYALAHPGQFDLVLICDVLHHVPWDAHPALLRAAGRLLRPGGVLVVKDWERIPNVGHVLCALSDRVITGDEVRYGTAGEFRRLLEAVFGPGAVAEQSRVPPWRNNLIFLVRPGNTPSAVDQPGC
jgi:2-polyprenyl-6-hydroxyphenyl methylase/3-demethylubiquinone-9 3-methyltransferase